MRTLTRARARSRSASEVEVSVEGGVVGALGLLDEVGPRHGGERHRQVVPDVPRVGVERERLEVALRGGLVRAHVAVGDAEVGEGAHILRLALERLHVARHRRLATHRVGLRGAELVPQRVVLRSNEQRRLEGADSERVLAREVVEDSEDGVDVGAVGRELSRAQVEVGHLLLQSERVVALVLGRCLGGERGELGVGLNPVVEVEESARLVELVGEAHTEREQRVEVVRVGRDGLAQ
mmetsp:Transcript_63536/g.169351  ORF Transcript_63536/g.169351 Transcript_63536/m.169351 type:complete len:237 (-) Transcript_63536:413-1123(-)